VARGQEIATAGNQCTGAAHLHFETLTDQPYSSQPYITDPYGWFGTGTSPIGAQNSGVYRWASGFAPSNSATDPANWNSNP